MRLEPRPISEPPGKPLSAPAKIVGKRRHRLARTKSFERKPETSFDRIAIRQLLADEGIEQGETSLGIVRFGEPPA